MPRPNTNEESLILANGAAKTVYQYFFVVRKKVVEVSFLPADVEEVESHSLPKHSFDISFYVRKFRQIKVSEHNKHPVT